MRSPSLIGRALRAFGRAAAPIAIAGLGAELCACGDSSGAGGAGGTNETTSVTASAANGSSTNAQSGSPSSVSATSTGTGVGGASGTPIFVAVGYGGRRMTSPDGIQWGHDIVVDPNGGDDDNLFRGVGFVNGSFVAVGGSAKGQNAVMAPSQDWTFHDPATSWLADVVALGNVIVTAGGNGLRQRSLDGGLTWVDPGDYYAGHFRGIAAGDGIAVAAGHTYGNSMSGLSTTTTDGKTWTAMVVGGTPFSSIAFGQHTFVAAGDARCSTSADGQAWTDCAGVSGPGLDGVVFANGQFIIGNASGYYVSADGNAWQHQDGEHHSVAAFGEGLYVGLDWPDKIYTSPDLVTWTVRQQNTGPAFVQVAFGSVSP